MCNFMVECLNNYRLIKNIGYEMFLKTHSINHSLYLFLLIIIINK